MDQLSNHLDIALRVIKKGMLIFNNNVSKYNQLEMNSGRDIKIRGDKELNNILIKELKKASSFNIISEEESGGLIQEHKYNWILDPIDGSYNYFRGIPIYCISLGLWKGLKPVLGVICDLARNDVYHGVIDEGAYKNNREIRVSEVRDFSNGVLCTGFPLNYSYSKKNITNSIENILKYKKIRLLGSAAMSLSLLACGKVDAYQEDNIMIWDVAAGIAIVMAAGGNVKFSRGDVKNSLFVFANNGSLSIKAI